jgi:hypothetical protein
MVNARTRVAFETALAKALGNLPQQGEILMAVSSDVGALQQAGIPLRRTINEGDYLTWQRALKDPAHNAAAVVAVDGDVVAEAVRANPQDLQLINVVCSTAKPCARIYRSGSAGR